MQILDNEGAFMPAVSLNTSCVHQNKVMRQIPVVLIT